MVEESRTFSTKLTKDTSSFCIDSLLSCKTTERKEPQHVNKSPESPSSSPTSSLPYPPPSSPGRFFLPPHLAMLPHSSAFHPPPSSLAPPPGLEALFKQEFFPSQNLPLEILARSGMFYQNFPHFAGESSLSQQGAVTYSWTDTILNFQHSKF